MTNTVSKLSINRRQIYLQFCGDKFNPVFNPYFHQSGLIKITWQFVSMNMTKTVCLVTTFVFCYETVLKWEMMAECKIDAHAELISNNFYFFSNPYPFSTRSMNRREQSLSRALTPSPSDACYLLCEQLLSYFRPASSTKPLGVHHCGLCSLLELYRQYRQLLGWKAKNLFNGDQTTCLLVLLRCQNPLSIRGRTSDVIFMEERLKHEGSSSQWLIHVMNLTLESICRYPNLQSQSCVLYVNWKKLNRCFQKPTNVCVEILKHPGLVWISCLLSRR